jgi:hypothetical protein
MLDKVGKQRGGFRLRGYAGSTSAQRIADSGMRGVNMVRIGATWEKVDREHNI